MMRTILLLLGVLVAAPTAQGNSNDEWTWIHGQLEDEDDQRKYLDFASRMFEYYQDRGSMTGQLVAEGELESIPEEHIVVIGPIQAFEDFARFDLPMEVEGDEVVIGGQRLDAPRTGIYLAGKEQKRYAYTGLSLDGFQDIFSVPTGDRACTVTRGRGRVDRRGDWGPEELVLEASTFLVPYPSEAELSGFDVPEGALEMKPVVTEPGLDSLEPEFADWLDTFVEGQRVLFFGESHWNTGVNHLFNLVVEHLLEAGELRAVFLEVNYSFSGYYDYYITEPDEERAMEFLETRLHPLISSSSSLDLLELLRAWNLDHPDRPVRVGCLDMEWNTSNVVRNIIQPYFERVDDAFAGQVTSEEEREHLQELLAKAMAEEVVGEYPFLTPEYVDTVLANLWDTIDIGDFSVDRQRGIIRNVTEFNGHLLEDGLVLFKGGGWHAVKQKLDGESFYRDAAYLQEVHPPTKGKVVSLYTQGLGYSFAEIADLRLGQYMSSATNYNNLVREFQKALADGRAERNTYYILDGDSLGHFDRLVAKVGYAAKRDYLRIDSVDWEKLTAVHGQGVLQNRVRDYDATVFILRAGIEVMRPREF